MTTPIPITDELVKEFIEEHLRGIKEVALDRWQQFLASRQVKDWEIVSMVTSTKSEDVHDQNSLCDEMGCVPYSVRRLPSNEVFTVGEETKEGKIISFKVENNEMLVDVGPPIFQRLSNLHKLPSKPVFRTNDGKDIFLGMDFYVVDDNFRIFEWKATALDNTCSWESTNTFSTREAAEKYVKENKPMYSAKMVRMMLEETEYVPSYVEGLIKKLDKYLSE